MITFSTKHHADISMFDSHATELLTMMGHSGKTPGALLAEDVPAALERLQHKLDAQASRDAKEGGTTPSDEEDEEPPVGPGQRAWPLIQLLKAAKHRGENVMWK